MKKLSTITLGVIALAAGSVYAGGFGDCNHGKHSPIVSAEAEDALENSAGDESIDPRLLALLKKQQAEAAAETVTN